jgi:hypothetical protein
VATSWVVVRIADQTIVGHYRSRREAAEKAFQFSSSEPHVAVRNVGPGWPGQFALGGRAGPHAATGAIG